MTDTKNTTKTCKRESLTAVTLLNIQLTNFTELASRVHSDIYDVYKLFTDEFADILNLEDSLEYPILTGRKRTLARVGELTKRVSTFINYYELVVKDYMDASDFIRNDIVPKTAGDNHLYDSIETCLEELVKDEIISYADSCQLLRLFSRRDFLLNESVALAKEIRETIIECSDLEASVRYLKAVALYTAKINAIRPGYSDAGEKGE